MPHPTPSPTRRPALLRALLRTLGLALALALAGPVPRASAQLVPGVPIAVELRTSAAMPLGDFRGENPGLGAGVGLGAALALHVEILPWLGAYGSYDYGRFGCGACDAAGFEGPMPEAGFEAGVETTLLSDRLWAGVGALFGRRLEIPDGVDGFASEAATGFSVGAGALVPLTPSLLLRPALRYRTWSATFDFSDLGFGIAGAGAPEQEVDVTSLALEIGVSYAL